MNSFLRGRQAPSSGQQIPCFYGTWRFINMSTKSHHCTVHWATLIQSTTSYPTSLKVHLNFIMLSTPGIPKWSLSLGFRRSKFCSTSHSYRGDPCSRPGQSMWDLWWTKRTLNRFFSESSISPCKYHHTAAPYSLMYHMEAGQWARLWSQFHRNIVWPRGGAFMLTVLARLTRLTTTLRPSSLATITTAISHSSMRATAYNKYFYLWFCMGVKPFSHFKGRT
jgi:hypothetical protein